MYSEARKIKQNQSRDIIRNIWWLKTTQSNKHKQTNLTQIICDSCLRIFTCPTVCHTPDHISQQPIQTKIWFQYSRTFGFKSCIGASPSCIHPQNLSVYCVRLLCVTNVTRITPNNNVLSECILPPEIVAHKPLDHSYNAVAKTAGQKIDLHYPGNNQPLETAPWATSRRLD